MHFQCINLPLPGYPNILRFLAPYRGERYHLSEFHGRRKFQSKHECFNSRHSSCRNVIERAFGVLKSRFHILKSIPYHPLRRQKLIHIACCALHNFIRQEYRVDTLFTQYGREGMELSYEIDTINVVQEGVLVDMSQQQKMNIVRETIANQLWVDYDNHTSSGR